MFVTLSTEECPEITPAGLANKRAIEGANGEALERMFLIRPSIETMETPDPAIDDKFRLQSLAGVAVLYDLSGEEFIHTVRLYEKIYPFSQPVDEAALQKAMSYADQTYERGREVRTSTPPGVKESADDERRLASLYIQEYEHAEAPGIRPYGGSWWIFHRGWQERSKEAIKDELYEIVKHDFQRLAAKTEKTLMKVSNTLLGNVDTAMRSLLRFNDINVPTWIGKGPGGPHLTFRNGILSLDAYFAGETDLMPLTPRYFDPYGLNYDFEHTTREPEALLGMLRDQCQTDEIEFLQEFFGLCFIPELKYERGLLIYGPSRSGKGTFLKTLIKAIGPHNHVSKDLYSFHEKHALDNVAGKLVVGFPDERKEQGKDTTAGVSRLLKMISGDYIDVQRKYKTSDTKQLVARAIILANYLPELPDEAGALQARLGIVRTRKSYSGREDRNLFSNITADMPAVVCWALRGLKRLQNRGDFKLPDNGAATQYTLVNAPISTFVRQCCVLGDGAESKERMYESYSAFMDKHNQPPLERDPFFKQLYDNFSNLQSCKPTKVGQRVPSVRGVTLSHYGVSLLEEM